MPAATMAAPHNTARVISSRVLTPVTLDCRVESA
jgi:hypothetical protein